jgi:hypothetical protein
MWRALATDALLPASDDIIRECGDIALGDRARGHLAEARADKPPQMASRPSCGASLASLQ